MSLSMTPAVYEEKRNELVGLLDEAITLLNNIAIHGKKSDALEEIRQVRRKVFEDQFTIALMASFQGGKSTTFDALCDGMEISPRGVFLETSATVITAQNTTDDSEVDTATIRWRTQKELALVFVTTILPYLREHAPERFKNCATEYDVAGVLDFREDSSLIQRALEHEWKKWKSNKSRYPSDNLDTLRIASIIFTHYASPEIEELKEKSTFHISEISSLVRFPDKFKDRFADGDATQFSAAECAFAFIYEIDCKVRSRNLARTGSVIIDCPGLFASRYDTTVTEDILRRADAVWFLCGSGKELSESELSMISTVADTNPERLFITINMKGSSRHNQETNIRPAIIATLDQKGISGEVYLYNALLALCAAQGEKLLSGGMDPHSAEAVRDMHQRMMGTPFDSAETALAEAVEEQLQILKIPERKLFIGMDESGVGIARSASGFDAIIDAVEGHVIRTKARSILVENGVLPVENELGQLEAKLESVENDIALSKENAENGYRKAEEALKEFKNFVMERMRELNFYDDIIEITLASDCWQSIMLAAIENASTNAAKRIHSMPSRWLILNPTQEDMKDAVANAFNDEVRALTEKWNARTRDGKNRMFNSTINARLNALSHDAEKKWKALSQDLMKLKGLPHIRFSSTFSLSSMSIGNIQNFGFSWSTFFGQTLRQSPLVNRIFTQTIDAFKENALHKTAKGIQNAIRETLISNKETALDSLKSDIQKMRESFTEKIEGCFDVQEVELGKMHEDARALFEKTNQEKIAISDKCNYVRVNYIEPLHKRLTSYRESLAVLENTGNE